MPSLLASVSRVGFGQKLPGRSPAWRSDGAKTSESTAARRQRNGRGARKSIVKTYHTFGVSPRRVFSIRSRASSLLLYDAIEAGVARMAGGVQIRIGEGDIARQPGDERRPDSRRKSTGELDGVELTGHAEPGDGPATAIGGDARDDRLADPHGEVVNHHGPRHGPGTAGGEFNREL